MFKTKLTITETVTVKSLVTKRILHFSSKYIHVRYGECSRVYLRYLTITKTVRMGALIGIEATSQSHVRDQRKLY